MSFPTNITVYNGIATFEDGTQIEATVEQLRATPDLIAALETISARWPSDEAPPRDLFDGTEADEDYGYDLAVYEMAMDARAVLAKLRP